MCNYFATLRRRCGFDVFEVLVIVLTVSFPGDNFRFTADAAAKKVSRGPLVGSTLPVELMLPLEFRRGIELFTFNTGLFDSSIVEFDVNCTGTSSSTHSL